MTTLLKIQTSLFKSQGQSSVLADRFAERWFAQHSDGKIISRDLAADPVPHLSLERFQAFITAPGERTPEQQDAVAYSDTLIEELKSADVIVLGVPMYNYSVPSVLRAYFDHIARAGVTFRYTANGPEGLLQGKKAYVFITRGGVHGEEHSQTQYLRQFLGFLGITDVEIVHAEGLALNEGAKLKSLSEAQGRISQLLAA
jgi:FMN-dependent NADH-azoreductase